MRRKQELMIQIALLTLALDHPADAIALRNKLRKVLEQEKKPKKDLT